ncbi:glycerol dehydratase reactivase beta/small subunit family protein [soil metagenome]
MLDGGQPEKPAILVISGEDGPLEKEVLAGIEEEGVPSVIERPGDCDEAVALACLAAGRSSLHVGVGIDSGGRICVQHDKLAQPLDELVSGPWPDLPAARVLGHNAARIVVGIPLIGDELS